MQVLQKAYIVHLVQHIFRNMNPYKYVYNNPIKSYNKQFGTSCSPNASMDHLKDSNKYHLFSQQNVAPLKRLITVFVTNRDNSRLNHQSSATHRDYPDVAVPLNVHARFCMTLFYTRTSHSNNHILPRTRCHHRTPSRHLRGLAHGHDR